MKERVGYLMRCVAVILELRGKHDRSGDRRAYAGGLCGFLVLVASLDVLAAADLRLLSKMVMS